MQRYFVKDKQNNQFIFYDQDVHHIKTVMRYKVGDNIEIVYNSKIYICKITSIDPLNTMVVEEKLENNEMSIDLTVAVALVNEQKFDLILQKLTELGVSKIIPIKTERSIIKIDAKKEIKKQQRWQTICKEASEQTHRNKIPVVENVMTLKELAKEKHELKLICSLQKESKSINEYLTKDINNILFTIGPEGGFSTNEEKYLLENSFMPITLGKRVLRVETAAIYVASIINYIYEG